MALSKEYNDSRINTCKNICWTLNNPTEKEINHLLAIKERAGRTDPWFKLFVFQIECGENGTVHAQGYLQLWKGLRYTSSKFRNLMHPDGKKRFHFEVARGSPQHNLDYCTKDKTRCDEETLGKYFAGSDLDDDKVALLVLGGAGPFIGGVQPTGGGGGGGAGQGSRTDLKSFVAAIKDGKTNAELLDSHPVAFLKFNKHAEAVRLARGGKAITLDMVLNDEVPMPKVLIIQGPTGSGKSHHAMVTALSKYSAEEIYHCEAVKGGVQWHDSLVPEHKAMIIHEEVPYNYRTWLRITDKWGYPFPRRGVASLFHKFELIIVATTLEWRTWFKAGETALGEFARRIAEVHRMFDKRVAGIEYGPFGLDGRPARVADAPAPAEPPTDLPEGSGVVSEVGGSTVPPTSVVPVGHFAPVAPAPYGISDGGEDALATFKDWLAEVHVNMTGRKRAREEPEHDVPAYGEPVYEPEVDEEPGGARSPKKARRE